MADFKLGQAVMADLGMGRGPVPGVVSKIEDGECLICNVYWTTPYKPDGFEWAGWITVDELRSQQPSPAKNNA